MNYNNKLYISQYIPDKILSEEEFKDYFDKMHQGDKEARTVLQTHNLKLVIYTINKYFKNTSIDKEDLVSIGAIGLIKAIDLYDYDKGKGFFGFATIVIKNEILMILRKSRETGMCSSFETPTGYDKNGYAFTLGETIKSDFNVIEDYEQKEEYRRVREAVDLLPDKEKQIIISYYGINCKRLSQAEIAANNHLTQPNISRHLSNSIKKLGLYLNSSNNEQDTSLEKVLSYKKVGLK